MRGFFDSTQYDLVASYAPADSHLVMQIATRLREAGVRAWFAFSDMPVGMPWIEAMLEALNAARVIVQFIGSTEYSRHERAFVLYESGMAAERYLRSRTDTTIIPVLLPGAGSSVIPESLRNVSYIALEDSTSEMLDRLVALLCMRVSEINQGQPRARIFLCHAKEDDERVKALFLQLRDQGFDPWYDKNKLDVGDRWEEEIISAIENSDFFAICLSPIAVTKRGFIQKEIRTAIREFQRRAFDWAFLLPIRFEDCEVPKIRIDENTTLESIQWADLFPGDKVAFDRFAKGVWKQWNLRNKSDLQIGLQGDPR
jgi:hypothetical protein